MPREGIKSTSIPDLYVKLIDKLLEEKKNEFILKNIRLSRAAIIEIALLKFLEIQGVLERYLKELGLEDSAIEGIKERLKVVG